MKTKKDSILKNGHLQQLNSPECLRYFTQHHPNKNVVVEFGVFELKSTEISPNVFYFGVPTRKSVAQVTIQLVVTTPNGLETGFDTYVGDYRQPILFKGVGNSLSNGNYQLFRITLR